MIRKFFFRLFIIFFSINHLVSANTTSITSEVKIEGAQGYIASNDSIKQFFDALSNKMNKSIIVSNLAARKKISGNFDLSDPEHLLEKITRSMGLIWYYDGGIFYIFDGSELKSGIVRLKNSTVSEIKRFLVSSKLYDERYPLRAESGGKSFYFSGPPLYYDLVLKAADNVEQMSVKTTDSANLIMLPLYNNFVEDRKYRYRDEVITIPGVASVIRSLVLSNNTENVQYNALTSDNLSNQQAEPFKLEANSTKGLLPLKYSGEIRTANLANEILGAGDTQVIANPGNNSLLVRGSEKQLNNIKQLVNILDVPKRHVEMSVWIIDLQKKELEQLGINWRGTFNLNNKLGISLNDASSSTVDGVRFMAEVKALAENNRANIVARPMLLTQENVPAIFDNSRTYYVSLVGERSNSLEHVTWGTSLSVIPRFTDTEEIEMMLNVEDGSQEDQSNSGNSNINHLPLVGRTNISTVARVPKGKSLLIGGYTLYRDSNARSGIPVLSDIPIIGKLFSYNNTLKMNMVRVFLIEPKEIDGRNIEDSKLTINRLRNKAQKNDNLFDWMNNFLEAQK